MPTSLREFSNRPLLIALAIGLLNAVGFFLLIALIVPQHLQLHDGAVFGIGLGLTAWTLGARHAFDADHIAAIDNATRKLMKDGKDATSVGFFFSLGHSSIVVALGALVAFGVEGIGGVLEDESSTLNLITGTWGPTVAGVFLLIVGLLNLAVLVGIARAMLRSRGADATRAQLEAELADRGFLARFYERATRTITKPWQMYPIGVMFGFGFDTATEIALLVLAGGAAASGLPFYAVMCLPILFAAGMTLFDTLNSGFMRLAYGWATASPIKRLYYNFTVTTISVLGALAIGALSLAGVLIERLGLDGGVWDLLAAIDLRFVGFAMVALFVLVFATSLAVWRFGDIERRLGSAAIE